jgi:hypothetical protein
MRRCCLPSIPLLLLWFATAAAAQVSRSTPVVAPSAVLNIVPRSVGKAALVGLDQMGLPPGTKAFVKSFAPSSLSTDPIPGLLYQREQRDGKAVLVETAYEPVKGTFGQPKLKATGEWLYPGDTKLVYTGPWVTGTVGMGLKHITLEGYAAYLLLPLNVAAQRSTPRMGIATAATVVSGTTAPPKSGTPAKAPTLALAKPQDCGVKVNPESTGDANQLRGLVCFLFTQDGQGMTLPDGTRLFRRNLMIEHWKGDSIIQSSYGVLVRDAQGRYWFLESKGWL